MNKLIMICSAALLAVGLSGCAINQVAPKDMSAFTTAAPASILVVPIVNHSLDVDAPNYVLTTLPIPLAEKGYYVYPVNTVKVVLEQEGLYEGEAVQQQPTEKLAAMFGADAVLYVKINQWDAKYAVITTSVTVDFDYRMVSKNGVEIFNENKRVVYSPESNLDGSPLLVLIDAVVNSALARAKPNYMPLTREANAAVFNEGPNALPDGPYRRTRIN